MENNYIGIYCGKEEPAVIGYVSISNNKYVTHDFWACYAKDFEGLIDYVNSKINSNKLNGNVKIILECTRINNDKRIQEALNKYNLTEITKLVTMNDNITLNNNFISKKDLRKKIMTINQNPRRLLSDPSSMDGDLMKYNIEQFIKYDDENELLKHIYCLAVICLITDK